MIVTVLAVIFLLVLSGVAYFGYSILGKRTVAPGEINTEECSVCRKKFIKEELVLRQIGDYKMLYFCKRCIMSLYNDLGLKN